MANQSLGARCKQFLKRAVFRAMRPGLIGVYGRFDQVHRRLDGLHARLDEREAALNKYHGEVEYWRWLIKRGGAQKEFGDTFEVVFARWQRQRLVHLGHMLGISDPESAEQGIDAWCRGRSVVEIGAGPYPSVAAARQGWKRCVAVDPLARKYVEEGLLPAACDSVTYIESPGEHVPLPGEFADLVIIENCLDHVTDPAAVMGEIRRLLKPGGLLWLCVDLSNHTDYMHPHAMDEARLRVLLRAFTLVNEEISTLKAHPKAYGGYRGLYRRPDPGRVGATAGLASLTMMPGAVKGPV
jgi:SAM-dependent methyltransferase